MESRLLGCTKSGRVTSPHHDLQDYRSVFQDTWHILGTYVKVHFFEKNFLKSDPRKSLPAEISASKTQKMAFLAKNETKKFQK